MAEPDHEGIYRQEALQYHELISKQPELAGVIEGIRPFAGLDIVDLGAGTGRLSEILAPGQIACRARRIGCHAPGNGGQIA